MQHDQRVFEAKRGLFGRVIPMQTLLCVCFVPGTQRAYTGTLSGELYTWEGAAAKGRREAHKVRATQGEGGWRLPASSAP